MMSTQCAVVTRTRRKVTATKRICMELVRKTAAAHIVQSTFDNIDHTAHTRYSERISYIVYVMCFHCSDSSDSTYYLFYCTGRNYFHGIRYQSEINQNVWTKTDKLQWTERNTEERNTQQTSSFTPRAHLLCGGLVGMYLQQIVECS